VPILANTIFPILHIFVRFSYKCQETSVKSYKDVCTLCKLQIFVIARSLLLRFRRWPLHPTVY
jgi:hypothetical protein